MKQKIIGALFCVFTVAGCADRQAEVVLGEAETQEVCKLTENISPIKMPQSFDILDDNHFVLTDWEQVYLYDFSGNQIQQIGATGRAQFEYNRPAHVRVHDGRIYVWSSGTLRFIEYTADGTPVAEYPYDSAVTDFRVSGDNIFIYTAGRRIKNVIDVYDKSSASVKTSLTPSTKEHRFSLHNISSTPMYCDGKSLAYASKDNMSLYLYDRNSGSAELLSDYKSESFEVEEVTDTNMLYTNWDKALKYYNENPITIFVAPNEKGYYLLTAEGEFEMKDNNLADGTRYIGLYDIRRSGSRRIASYTYSSIGTQDLYAYWKNEIYFIRHKVEDDDIYTLEKLCIK